MAQKPILYESFTYLENKNLGAIASKPEFESVRTSSKVLEVTKIEMGWFPLPTKKIKKFHTRGASQRHVHNTYVYNEGMINKYIKYERGRRAKFFSGKLEAYDTCL